MFLDAVSEIDDDIVERFVAMDDELQAKAQKTRTKGAWLRFGAIAACLAVVTSAIVAIILVPVLESFFIHNDEIKLLPSIKK